MNRAEQKSVIAQPKRSKWTTRGTPRRRATKGYWSGIRREVLATKSDEVLEDLLQSQLRSISISKRQDVEAELHGQARSGYVLNLLSRGYPGSYTLQWRGIVRLRRAKSRCPVIVNQE